MSTVKHISLSSVSVGALLFALLLSFSAFGQTTPDSGGHCKSKYKATSKYTPPEIETDKIDEAIDGLKDSLDSQIEDKLGTAPEWVQSAIDKLTSNTKSTIKTALNGVGKGLGPPNIKSSAFYDRCEDSWGDQYATIKGRSSFTIKVGSLVDVAGSAGYDGSCSGKITYECVNPSLDPTEGKSTTVTSSVKWTVEITANLGFKPGVNGSISVSITDTFDLDHEQDLEAD